MLHAFPFRLLHVFMCRVLRCVRNANFHTYFARLRLHYLFSTFPPAFRVCARISRLSKKVHAAYAAPKVTVCRRQIAKK